jgi:16S rRNA (adenine1518-N6/adenine1519-N6)-dimethyltransferase
MVSKRDVIRPSDVRRMLKLLGVNPRKSMGQNFLVDRNVAEKILNAAGVCKDDLVLEIGPGLGALTDGIVELAKGVVVVELDDRLFCHLQARFRGSNKIRLIHADVLELDLDELLQQQGAPINKVVANLPYSSGSRILVGILRAQCVPDTITVTVQREVADRLVAPPGGKDYGLLGIWAQRLYDVSVERNISATCFWPEPDITSSVVVFHKHNRHPLDSASEMLFYRLTKRAFSQRRKQLASILSREKGKLHITPVQTKTLLADMGKQGTVRPESLDVGEWCRLTAFLAEGQ